ncbi:disease resistance protein At4g27190-like [Coffea eugenioides]|uniref:disease resistance protein At4g27190-like n=1 Tax=Coffea eugenioides TaxID=49369 RepID=UPI000F606D9B|nr:disease resistance protein At4g27190-like [Coffea eugenioides]
MAIQDIALSIVGPFVEKCVNPILRQFKYLIFYKSNVQTLSNEINGLGLQQAEVQRLIDAAENNAEKIKPTVTDWMKNVDDLKKEAYTISQGRRAAKKTDVAQKLIGEGKFDQVGYISPLGKMTFSEQTQSSKEGLVSRMSKKKEVIEALMEDKTSLVAICGMPGVGKTFLVEQIADQVKFEKLFDEVAKANLSQIPNTRTVQDQLAEQLGLKISEETDHAKAERMYTRLSKGEKRILVILDDVREEVDFKSLGIPVRGECKGLKVILTSRLSHVCSRMGAKIFEVDALPKEEARHLFKEVVGISDDSTLSDVPNQVADECKGLPLAIVVVAKAFKSKHTTPESWNIALRQLKKYTMRDIGGVQDLVFSSIMWSYDHLESAEAKSLLLLCSLFPEDYSIPLERLVRYGKGLQLFHDRETLGDVRDRVHMLINELKKYYLLVSSDGEQEDFVKLHNVVRDVCLSIASKGEHVFLVRNARVEERHPYAAISLTVKDYRVQLLPFGKKSPWLKLLRLSALEDDQFPRKIAQMSNLKLLDLRVRRSLQPLPRGILSSLKKLEELYLAPDYHLHLGRDKEEERECIKEIISLSNLECLQIHVYDLNLLLQLLHGFPAQRLSRFLIEGAAYNMGWRDLSRDFQFGRTFELHLSQDEQLKQALDPAVTRIVKRAETLTLDLYDVSSLRNLVSDLDKDGLANLKRLQLVSGVCQCLVDSTTNLVAPHVFGDLVFMNIVECSLQEICHGNLPPRCFSQLQEVKLQTVDTIKYLWMGTIEPPSLCNLSVIEVTYCDQITVLFSQSILKCLVKLRSLTTENCKELVNIVMREESKKKEVLELPQLKVLVHKHTTVTGFGTKDDSADAFFHQVSLPSLEELEFGPNTSDVQQIIGGEMPSQSLENLKFFRLEDCQVRWIAKADGVIILQNLQRLEAHGCDKMKSLFEFEGLKVPRQSHEELAILPKLESLTLRSSGLTHIWRNFPTGVQVFRNLRNLKVWHCRLLQCLFYPPCVANMLVSLEVLVIGCCDEMHGVIGEEDEEISQEDDVGNHREIALERTNKEFVFPKLSSLGL